MREPPEERPRIREIVVSRIVKGEPFAQIDNTTFKCGEFTLHVRFCSQHISGKGRYWFSIGQKALHADFEVWICGSEESYYVLPAELVSEMYHHKESIIDRRYPERRIVTIDITYDEAYYAKPSLKEYIGHYFCATFDDLKNCPKQAK